MAIDMTTSKTASTIRVEGGQIGRPAVSAMKKRAPRDIELITLEEGDILNMVLTDEQFDNQIGVRNINGAKFPGMLLELDRDSSEMEYFAFPGIFERSVQEYEEVDDRLVKTSTPRAKCSGDAVNAYQNASGSTYDRFKALQGKKLRVDAVTPVTTLAFGGGALTERNVYEINFVDAASDQSENA